jgi:serine protease Do
MRLNKRFMKILLVLRNTIFSFLLAMSAGMVIPMAATAAAPAVATPSAALPDFTDLVESVGPAVVNIRTTQKLSPGQGFSSEEEEMQEFFRRFFGVPLPPQQPRRPNPRQEEEVPRGVGSGFIISADGYVMTNAHVIDGADDVYVTLNDKREFKAKVIGADRNTDVALVKIEGSNLPRLRLGDSNKLRVGEWVIAIGSPFGLDNTVTAGIVSAKARDTGEYLPLIQTDVAVNPGNSGGPLINMRGEVVGINSQIYSRSGGYMGISFAVPIDEAIRVSEQLRETGRVTRGRIGVQINDVTKEVAETLGLSRSQGALITRVEPGGPAELAGLEAGDIILRYNGVSIEKASDLPRLVGSTKPGTKSTITVWRKGSSRDIQVTVVEMEADRTARRDEQPAKPAQSANALGLVVTDLSDVQKQELRLDGGVLVESAEGPAGRAGLRGGDLILRLNNTDIVSAAQFNALVAKLESGKAAVLLVRRGESSQFFPVRPGGK